MRVHMNTDSSSFMFWCLLFYLFVSHMFGYCSRRNGDIGVLYYSICRVLCKKAFVCYKANSTWTPGGAVAAELTAHPGKQQ